MHLIKGMTVETAMRYIKVRKEIEIIIDRIHTLGDLISMDKDTALIGQRIKSDAILILRCLDICFIHITPEDLKELDISRYK